MVMEMPTDQNTTRDVNLRVRHYHDTASGNIGQWRAYTPKRVCTYEGACNSMRLKKGTKAIKR